MCAMRKSPPSAAPANSSGEQKPRPEAIYTYKSNQRFSKLPASTLDINYLKKLFEILTAINKEGMEHELTALEKGYEKLPGSATQDAFDKLKANVLDSYKIHVEIRGAKGEYMTSDSSSILEEKHLPDFVTSIRFDNHFFYKVAFARQPQYLLEVFFDFTKPPLLDFVSNPSFATANNSLVHIQGESETWVPGSHEKIMSSIKERHNSRAWLHRSNVYTLFLCLVVLPLAFWNLRKFDLLAGSYLSQFSPILTVAVYVYIFIVILNIFRFAFNYGRWLFPYLELKTSLKGRVIKHRLGFIAVLSAIAFGLAKDGFLALVKYLF